MRDTPPPAVEPESPDESSSSSNRLRASLLSARSQGLECSLQALRLSLIDQLLTGTFVVALIGTPMSLSRALSTG